MSYLLTLSLTAGLLLSAPAVSSLVSRPVRSTTIPHVAGPGLAALPPVYFCGESVPLHEEVVARRLVSALARNTKHNDYLFLMRQRASKFFPVIEPILARHKVPIDFKYLHPAPGDARLADG